MKKILSLGCLLLLFSSCEEYTVSEPTQTTETHIGSDFKRLKENIRIPAGKLSIYTYGPDTLYVVEGASQSYPVGVTVK